MPSYPRVHAPGWGWRSISRTPSKRDILPSWLIQISDLTNHLLESIYTWTIVTIDIWLRLNGFKPLGRCPRMRLEVKIKGMFFFSVIETFIYEHWYYLGLTISVWFHMYVRVHDPVPAGERECLFCWNAVIGRSLG